MQKIYKHMRTDQIYAMAAAALDGESSALEIYHYLQDLKSAIEESLEQIKYISIDELEKYKERQIDDVVYKIKNGAGRWDYSNVAQWNEQKKKLKEIEELSKQVSKSRGMTIVDANGEVIEAATYTEGNRVIYKSK